MLELLLKAHRPEKYRENGASVLINNHQRHAEIALIEQPTLSPAAVASFEEARRMIMLEQVDAAKQLEPSTAPELPNRD
jgi:hypothetical protein